MTKLLRTCIIGLGEIARHHSLGLRHSPLFQLVSACDTNPHAVSRKEYDDVPFYTSLDRMLEEVKPDVAVVATPPASHFDILSVCEAHGVYALIEKPLAADRDEINQLLASLIKGKCNIIYHWVFSQEILWFKHNVRVNHARKFRFRVEDPYTDSHGQIIPSRRIMGGCWIDSGINVLSVLSLWMDDISSLKLVNICHNRDAEGTPVETHAEFRSGEMEVEVDISWKTGRNFKETVVWIDDKEYILHHSSQAVSLNGKTIFKDTGLDRLDRHYYNFYSLYPASIVSTETTRIIHRILLENQ